MQENAMNKISRQTARQKSVGNVLASLRISGLSPSPEVVLGLQAWLAGNAALGQVLANALNRHSIR